MDIIKALAEELNIGRHQAEAAVKLIDEGNTIPFIARYRKEATGSLNDEVLRNLDERLKYLRNLEDRKEQVISAISDQGKMTAELEKQIREAATLVAVEDLYRPYKPKRRTRAMIAREKGLEPLANVILLQNLKEPVEKAAEAYISVEKGVESVQDAINGAMDILAEGISDDAKYRTYIRNITMNKGLLQSTAKDGEKQSVYETYYNYEEPVKKAAGHRILALNRGEDEKILTVKVAAPTEQILGYLEKQVITKENPYTTPVLKAVTQDSYSRLIAPSVDREIRSELTDKAQEGAIVVVEDFNFEAPKTKSFIDVVNNLKVADKKVLVVLPEANKNVYLSARNLQGAKVAIASDINTYGVLNAGVMVVTENALGKIEAVLNK